MSATPRARPAGPPADGEVAALRARGGELRLAAALPGARLRPILEAALAEVDAAADALSRQGSGGRAPPAPRTPSDGCCTRCSRSSPFRCSCSARIR